MICVGAVGVGVMEGVGVSMVTGGFGVLADCLSGWIWQVVQVEWVVGREVMS